MEKLFIDELIVSPKINGANEETRNSIKQSYVFLVQNIIPAVPDKLDFRQLPRLAPPYENCWFEWTSGIQKEDNAPTDFSGELDERLLDILLNIEGDARAGVELTSNRNSNGGWLLYFQFFLKMGHHNPPLMFPIAYSATLNADGFFVHGQNFVEQGLNPALTKLAQQTLKDDSLRGYVKIVLYALGLLNCKNIVTIERGGQPVYGKRNRRRKWTHRHYVLQIRPMREITKAEHEGEPMERELSYHFCRGHFKTYTAEKPLFGKYSGNFWWDAHARGSIKTGIVTKDYSINPPQDE